MAWEEPEETGYRETGVVVLELSALNANLLHTDFTAYFLRLYPYESFTYQVLLAQQTSATS